jgi:hypothetical protein
MGSPIGTEWKVTWWEVTSQAYNRSVTNSIKLHQHLITQALDEAIARRAVGTTEWTSLEPTQASRRLARHVARELERVLDAVRGEGPDLVARQAAIANELIAHLQHLGATAEDAIAAPPRMLLSLHDGTPPPRTALPFTLSTLLTRAKGEPALGH